MSAKSLTKGPTGSQLKIVILCEDLESGKHAKEVQDQLRLSLSPKIEFVPEAWTFRALQHPKLQELARQEIDEADIILFSSRDGAEVPGAIKECLETPPTESNRPRALVALLGADKSAPRIDSTRLCLEEAAAKGCLEFFVGPSSDIENDPPEVEWLPPARYRLKD